MIANWSRKSLGSISAQICSGGTPMKLCSGTILTDIRLRDFLLPLLMNGQARIGGVA